MTFAKLFCCFGSGWSGKDVAVDESGEGIIRDIVSWWERVLFRIHDCHDVDEEKTEVDGDVYCEC